MTVSICPFAIWRPVTAHGGPIGTILGVVEHVTAGEGTPYNTFVNPANKVSSHFGILNGQGGTIDGRIEQYVDTQYESWAQAAGNSTYISVETEGQPTEQLTAAQVASFGKLMAWCHEVYAIPLVVTDTPGQRGLIAHGDGMAAWGGHEGCPGDLRKAQRPAILAAAGGVTPSNPTTVPGELFAMLASDPAFAVRFLFRFALHREVDPGAFTTNVNFLNGGGTLNQLLANIQDSDEGKAAIAAERKSLGLA